ncbi:ketol-acid reductoisomerase, partial [Francisella tularensis subsp. holarctica]|nr:ketol-acid reductoisomerase [Francisella tularensis subsp. holarctica]
STTDQRGALDGAHKFRDATKGVLAELYNEVKNGNEEQRTIDKNSHADSRKDLDKELEELSQKEVCQSGKTVRSLRPN